MRIVAVRLAAKSSVDNTFPSAHCNCSWIEPYGFVPEAECPQHDTKQFIAFVSFVAKRADKEVIPM